MSHLGGMNRNETRYWHWKGLYMTLPTEYQREINREYTNSELTGLATVLWSAVCENYIKRLSKLEQLIYTNEIQGE